MSAHEPVGGAEPVQPAELAKLTWPQARERFGPRTVAFLPIGSTEPHGPHLPLDVDVTIARAQARRAAERLGELGLPTLLLPPLAYGVTFFTEGFEGRVSLHPGTLWAVIEDISDSLAEQGVTHLVLANGHLEGAHVKVLRGLALDRADAAVGRGRILFPDNTRRRWAGTLGEEFQGGDCHAGRYETSIVLAEDPGAVREEERRALPAVKVDLIDQMRAGATSFRQIGAAEAYCGDPASATAEEGREWIEALAEMAVATVREGWPELFGGEGQALP